MSMFDGLSPVSNVRFIQATSSTAPAAGNVQVEPPPVPRIKVKPPVFIDGGLGFPPHGIKLADLYDDDNVVQIEPSSDFRIKVDPPLFAETFPPVQSRERVGVTHQDDGDDDFLHDVKKAVCKALPTILVSVVSVALSVAFGLPIKPLPTSVR